MSLLYCILCHALYEYANVTKHEILLIKYGECRVTPWEMTIIKECSAGINFFTLSFSLSCSLCCCVLVCNFVWLFFRLEIVNIYQCRGFKQSSKREKKVANVIITLGYFTLALWIVFFISSHCSWEWEWLRKKDIIFLIWSKWLGTWMVMVKIKVWFPGKFSF